MKQSSSCYLKNITRFTMFLFMLLFAATKTNAQWNELGGSDGTIFGYGGIFSIVTDTNGNVYAAGGFTNTNDKQYVAKWNGMMWSEVGGANGSPFNHSIKSIAIDTKGNIYAGGLFTISSGFINRSYVAKWDGTSWSELGGNSSPINHPVESIATDSAGNVYAAGDFTDANGKNYVAEWNGTTWIELGGTNGIPFNKNHIINSIAVDKSGNVYAAGYFKDANGKEYVARWDGTVWSELGGTNGSSFNGTIWSIATDAKGNVYAGGGFSDANSKRYVAKWNGTAWSELGGTNGDSSFSRGAVLSDTTIYSVATDAEENVYAGGDFIDASGSHYIAKWNGTAWSELGGANGALHSYLQTIAIDKKGNVYAPSADAFSHNYVAEYVQNILPITLISITATKVKKGVAINWQTATETNSSRFNVQRSTDGNSFANIGTVKAIGSGANSYQFIDNNPANGINYYRLKNVDKDGSFTYSVIKAINEAISFSASIYPNPVYNNLNLKFNSDKAKEVQVQIVNNEGKVITAQKVQVAAGVSMQNIHTASLNNGEYYIRLISEDGQTKLKFVKER